ncbi:hypothetical protein HF324_03140 [Chitinophaga oryzae]|uniref:DUF6630 domain-containing protein n=1 Tax=Chitinophaga oryzae TaxID=2725414 RepID=A0ABX6L9Z9_9BACT|nr:hypothetical protein [Chitinophaga oryzae]QJB36903.1 hypothetical protein HF324_03140 [Chitinophaga oryzae]
MFQNVNPTTTLTLEEAIEQGLTDHLSYDFEFLAEDVPGQKVLIFSEDVHTDQLLDLHNIYVEQDIAGMIFRGNLQVDNSIIDYEPDTYACFLLIEGNLTCRNLVAGCVPIHVKGNVYVRETFIGYYNHGEVTIDGDLHARLWIEDDHQTTVKGTVHAVTFAPKDWTATPDYTDWHDVLLPEVATQLLKEDYLFAGNADLLRLIEDGQPVFKQDLLRTGISSDEFRQLLYNELFAPGLDSLTVTQKPWELRLTQHSDQPGGWENDTLYILNAEEGRSFVISTAPGKPLFFGYQVADDRFEEVTDLTSEPGQLLLRYFTRACAIVNAKVNWNRYYRKEIDEEQLWQLIWLFNPGDNTDFFLPVATELFHRVALAADYPYTYIHSRYPEDSLRRGLDEVPGATVPVALLDGLLDRGLIAELSYNKPLSGEMETLNEVTMLYWNTLLKTPPPYDEDPVSEEYMHFVNTEMQPQGAMLIRLNAGMRNYLLACMPVAAIPQLKQLADALDVTVEF